MFEKVNPKHPDKIADCIAGTIVDLAYKNKRRILRTHHLEQYMQKI